MAQNKKVDVVTVGGGLVAGIMAHHLTKAGFEFGTGEPPADRWPRRRSFVAAPPGSCPAREASS